MEKSFHPFPFAYPPLVAEAFYKGRWLLDADTGKINIIVDHIISCFLYRYMLAGSPTDWYSPDLFTFGASILRCLDWRDEGFRIWQYCWLLAALEIFSIIVAFLENNYKMF